MIAMVTRGEHVRAQRLMRTEPGVKHFPGTDTVLNVCSTNQSPLWCLKSRLGLAKNRKLACVHVDLKRQHTQTQLDCKFNVDGVAQSAINELPGYKSKHRLQ